MQNSTEQLSTKNYSMNSTARIPKKSKKRRSIFSIPEPVEPQRIRRIKNRRNMVRNYREKIRDIYHQTDYLVSWKEDDLSCFIKPIEQTSSFAFFEKSTRSNYSTLSNPYNRNTYSKYDDTTLPYNSSESQHSNNFTESSNLVSIPTGAFPNSLFGSNNENENQNQYEMYENKPKLKEEQIQTYLSVEENEDQLRASLNVEENKDKVQPSFNEEEEDNEQFQVSFNEEDNEQFQVSFNEEENKDEYQFDKYQNDDETMERSTNFTEFSAIQATDQYEHHNIESKDELGPESFEEDTNAVDLSVNVIVFEEEEENVEDLYPFQNENIEMDFVGVDSLPLEDQYAPIFVTFQHYTEQDLPVGQQFIIHVNANQDITYLNFSNINETDIIEALVFLNDDEANPTLVSGIRLPVRSVDWDSKKVQIFDLISADDLRSGISVAKGDAGTIELVFKIL